MSVTPVQLQISEDTDNNTQGNDLKCHRRVSQNIWYIYTLTLALIVKGFTSFVRHGIHYKI